MRFTDQQGRETGHSRIKYMEHAPGLGDTFPCQSGYRHMHFTQPDDMSVRVPAVRALTSDYSTRNILGVDPGVGRILNWDCDEDREKLEQLASLLRLYNPHPFRTADILLHPEPPIVINSDDEGEPPAQPAPAKRPRPAPNSTRALRIETLLRRLYMWEREWETEC